MVVLVQYLLSCIVENIRQYANVCTHRAYTARLIVYSRLPPKDPQESNRTDSTFIWSTQLLGGVLILSAVTGTSSVITNNLPSRRPDSVFSLGRRSLGVRAMTFGSGDYRYCNHSTCRRRFCSERAPAKHDGFFHGRPTCETFDERLKKSGPASRLSPSLPARLIQRRRSWMMKWSRRRDRQHGMISWSRRAGDGPHHASEPVRERKHQGFKLSQDSLDPFPEAGGGGGGVLGTGLVYSVRAA